MNQGDVSGVLCPLCSEELYRMVTDARGQQFISERTIQEDSSGHYIKCAHCLERVRMDCFPGDPVTYDIAPGQQRN